MYHARMTGATPVATYHASMSGRKRSWAELELRLRRAISGETLRMHYQPKFSLSDGALRGVEALARWPDPEHGEIKPVQFIPVAEESSLIIDLGAWVIRAACRQIRQWQDRGLTVPIAINISAKELLYADPAGIIATEARAEGISTSLIEIEITESMMVRDSEAVSEAVRRFRQLGCRIALDDFGTGYSSMSYITRFRPDRIKIDRSFVTQVDASPADAAIAAAILSLGRSLNLTITAEGIERRGQLEWLRHSGCDEGQGYLLARPAAADAIDQWLHGTKLDESSTHDPIEVVSRRPSSPAPR
jgi:EAL domain-containing protein (putative c-di-GMP-specific phosphodiesterase class I)